MKWLAEGAWTFKNLALAVPDISEIPDQLIPDAENLFDFQHGGKPVFVGHYKMYGRPVLGRDGSALCLDYPNAACFYDWREGDAEVFEDQIVLV